MDGGSHADVRVKVNQVGNSSLGWGAESCWAQQLTPNGPAPLISIIEEERLNFLLAHSSKNALVIFDCLLDAVLQLGVKEIFAWERTFGLSWRLVTIFHSQVQTHYIQLPKKSGFALLSSFSVLSIGFQLVQWEYVAVIQTDENLWHWKYIKGCLFFKGNIPLPTIAWFLDQINPILC